VNIRKLDLSGVLEITPAQLRDDRGFFSETFNCLKFREAGLQAEWVQDNHSYSAAAGVLRGLHFQTPPFAQDKLVRVIHGAVFDVAVDIRHGSPDFGRWVSLQLSARCWNQIFIPKGFAHGFVTLEPDTEVIYKVSAPYSRDHDRSIRYDDPDIGIDWPPPASEFQLSAKDMGAPCLRDIDSGFRYQP
jgi:dTDP-4-dehydrorhamnose 3,5-epimerase